MNRYQIIVEIDQDAEDGRPTRRRLYEKATSVIEAEKQAEKRIGKYGPNAQIISVYNT